MYVPPLPPAFFFVWDAYIRLRSRKAPGMAGPAPIEWPDIDAFLRVTQSWLPVWAVSLIEQIDNIYLRSASEHASERDRQQALKDGLISAGERANVRKGQ